MIKPSSTGMSSRKLQGVAKCRSRFRNPGVSAFETSVLETEKGNHGVLIVFHRRKRRRLRKRKWTKPWLKIKDVCWEILNLLGNCLS